MAKEPKAPTGKSGSTGTVKSGGTSSTGARIIIKSPKGSTIAGNTGEKGTGSTGARGIRGPKK
jgi:hypothetical protein